MRSGARRPRVSWTPRAGWGAVVFRRDVLSDRGAPTRLVQWSEAPVTSAIDHDVAPGDVIAYRVAYMKRVGPGQAPVFGAPSGEHYVTIPLPPPPDPPALEDAELPLNAPQEPEDQDATEVR